MAHSGNGLIYHGCSAAAWEAARRAGTYRGSEQDRADGFMHFSTRDQAAESAELHLGHIDDLVLLEVKAADLGGALEWALSRGGALFPHLHGALDPALVQRAIPIGRDERGRPLVEEALAL